MEDIHMQIKKIVAFAVGVGLLVFAGVANHSKKDAALPIRTGSNTVMGITTIADTADVLNHFASWEPNAGGGVTDAVFSFEISGKQGANQTADSLNMSMLMSYDINIDGIFTREAAYFSVKTSIYQDRHTSGGTGDSVKYYSLLDTEFDLCISTQGYFVNFEKLICIQNKESLKSEALLNQWVDVTGNSEIIRLVEAAMEPCIEYCEELADVLNEGLQQEAFEKNGSTYTLNDKTFKELCSIQSGLESDDMKGSPLAVDLSNTHAPSVEMSHFIKYKDKGEGYKVQGTSVESISIVFSDVNRGSTVIIPEVDCDVDELEGFGYNN